MKAEDKPTSFSVDISNIYLILILKKEKKNFYGCALHLLCKISEMVLFFAKNNIFLFYFILFCSIFFFFVLFIYLFYYLIQMLLYRPKTVRLGQNDWDRSTDTRIAWTDIRVM